MTTTDVTQHTYVVPFQEPSVEIWDTKYRLKDRHDNPVDADIQATYYRVAKALASKEEDSFYWAREFKWALENGAVPAGRITSNAGAEAYKPAVSLINCVVSKNIRDSMVDILDTVKDAGVSLKAGSGIGFCFSTIRHRGAFVNGAGASTNGPLAFMDIFDKMCFTVASAGGRRGAMMATFDISHPDVEEYIEAKREDGRLRQFNMSLLITDEFVEAVKNDREWALSFPIHRKAIDHVPPADIVYRDWPVEDEDYLYDDQDRVACEIIRTVRAKDLWDKVMCSTYDYAEPGFILVDRVNEMNNNFWCESVISTNPCGRSLCLK